MSKYAGQHRGDSSAYAAYFAGMDASMQQKVALTTAFFPTRGRIADMGSGSGRGTYDLACLYPELEVIGVDINPVSVERARAEYKKASLSYEVGDIADPVFEEGSLDGVLDSSVLHHVTSFNDFSLARLRTCLSNQVAALRPGGVLIIRDFVIPDGPEQVLLDLPESDGVDTGTIAELSTAALFEIFAKSFRSSVHREGGVPYERVPGAPSGMRRFALALRDATEFILRKDYRADWEPELLEEYTYYSQADFERTLRGLGLRILTSVPIHNPWIVANRYRNKIALHATNGVALPFPPTNYFIVGEKIGASQPIALEAAETRELDAPRFFVPRSYRNTQSGELLALAERPGRTLDVIPWLVRSGRVCVLAKKGFPRPLLALHKNTSGFITEPIAAIIDEGALIEQAARAVLLARAGVPESAIAAVDAPTRYFTSPGGLDECVSAVLVQLKPDAQVAPISDYGDLGDSGTVRELDAAQLLRAAQVGGTFDARLEIGAYRALARAGQALDAWIGGAVDLPVVDATLPAPATRARSQVFEPSQESSAYLRFVEGTFIARAADGRELSRVTREHVEPRAMSPHTITLLPALRTPTGVHVALEARELPAAQRFTGDAWLDVCPAFRLPKDVRELPAIEAFAREQLAKLGLTLSALLPLGGAYAPTIGATPEQVSPFVAVIAEAPDASCPLRFESLNALHARIDDVLDGHLKIAVLRVVHALGA
jgi:SAM-dependent methyltransferase